MGDWHGVKKRVPTDVWEKLLIKKYDESSARHSLTTLAWLRAF